MPLKRIKPWWLGLLALISMGTKAGGQPTTTQPTMRVVSYNIENLFDTIDDPTTDDAEFLPEGSRRWTERCYQKKVRQISSLLSQMGAWQYPALVALVEVENSRVVEDLVKENALRKADYSFAVSRSADPRGIDVALLWLPSRFELVEAAEIPHYGPLLSYPLRRDRRQPDERAGTGRNTLWVTLREKQTRVLFDIFVIHAPSRRGGVRSTDEQRQRVLHKVRRVVDSVWAKRQGEHHIILMGDFNDNPDNSSLRNMLQARGMPSHFADARNDRLYNLAYPLAIANKIGSHYFEGRYWWPDQIILSGSLLNGRGGWQVEQEELQIYNPEWLRQGRHPKRTYKGTFYHGGYSDHFPIYIDLILNAEAKEHEGD